MSAHCDGRCASAPHGICRIAASFILASLGAVVSLQGSTAAGRGAPEPDAQLQPTISAPVDGPSTVISAVARLPPTFAGIGSDYASPQPYTLDPTPTLISGQVIDGATGAGLSGVAMCGLPGDQITDVVGNYRAALSSGWSGTVTPGKAGYSFSPPSRTYTSISGCQLDQGYTAAVAAILSVAPMEGLVSSGEQGGPFEPLSRDYTLTNVGTQPLDWSATRVRDWVSLSTPTSGTLAAGASTTLTVSIGAAAASLGVGTHQDTVSFVNTTTHAGDTTRGVQVTATGPGWVSSWTNRGFDLQVTGTFGAAPWDAHTNEHYVIVPHGATITVTVTRNANLRRADGSPSPADNTRVHIGWLTIAARQFWTPDWDLYDADGSFVYAWPVSVGPIDQPTPVQIWNQHPGCDFDDSSWLAYGSNAMEVWLIPDDLVPGNLPPVDYANGRLPPGQLADAPPGAWPALYCDPADEIRLHNAVAKLGTELRGDGGPYDDSSYGNYWPEVSCWAAKNALIGWHTGSSAHLNEAREQLLGLLSVRIYTNECSMWARARCVPNADFTTSYGRELSNVFFEAMVTACVLGPNMTNVLTPDELESVNAHLYRFAINDIFASLTAQQYYTANGSINLHYHPICVTAGWNWNVPEAVSIAAALPEPTHTACSYFVDDQGIGQYALRYCQVHDPTDKDYEHVGNSQSVRYWVRFSEFLNQSVDVYAAERYVIDHYAGLSLDCQDALDALMDGWQP
jgi:hypothetical protein